MSTPGGQDWQHGSGGQPQQPAPYFGGYQGSSDYQGLGVYPGASGQPGGPGGPSGPGGPGGLSGPGGPGGPGRNRTPIILSVVALVLLVAGGTTALALFGNQTTTGKPIAQPGAASSAEQPTSTTALPTDVNEVKIDAITPGWQGVLSPMEGVAYDVPASWKVESPTMRTGLEDKNGEPQTIMHGVSTAQPGTCTKGGAGPYLTETGFIKFDKKMDNSKAARAAAKMWADATSGKDTKAPDARQVKVAGGKATAHSSTVEVKPEPDSGCPAPKVNITTAAFDAQGKTTIFVVFNPQGVPGALKSKDRDKIIVSLRPAHQ